MDFHQPSKSRELRAQPDFHLGLHLLVVFGLSWPFQFAYAVIGEGARPILLVSMVMAGVGTFIAGRYLFGHDFKDAGWRWGKPRYYLLAVGLALFLWLLPVLVERALGLSSAPFDTLAVLIVFLGAFVITLLPALGEEFSWRGYLLPRLMERHSKRRALLLHGLITWIWHWPVLVVMGLGLELETGAASGILLVMLVSFVPAVLHALVFAWFWSVSGSLIVATVYHSSFDEVRDALESSVGLGVISANWQMLVLTLLGLLLLWKTSWLSPRGAV